MKNKLAVWCAAMVAVGAVALAGCGDSGQEKQIVRLSHTQIETHPHHIAAEAFEKYVEDKLGDKYDVQVYPNSTLGANEKVLELVKQGSVQMLVISTNNIEAFDPLYSLFSIPYVLTSEEALEKFIGDPQMLEKLGAHAKEDGFKPIAAYTAGSRSFYAKEPIYSVDDLQGKKFRVMAGPTNVSMMEAFGAAAAPMSFGEVYSALQQGVIDGAENNELALTDQKHGEVCKYYSYDMHQMCPDLLVISEKFYEDLPEADRKVFMDAAAESQKVATEAWHKRIEEARKQAEGMGVQFITVDVDEFRNKVLPLHQQILSANPELKPLYDEATKVNESVK